LELTGTIKILIIRLSSLGDILLTTPVVRAIKNKFPEAKIDFLLRKEYQETYKYNPNISKLLILDRGDKISEIISALKSTGYDLVIDLQNNFRSRKITRNLNSKVYRYNKPTLNKFFLVNFKINRFDKILKIPEMYSNSWKGIELDEKGPELFLPNDIETRIHDENNIIGFCPGSKHFTKQWLEEYFISLGKSLVEKRFKIVLFGGKEDQEICKRIANEINGAVNLSSDNKLLNMAAEMKKCRLIVCNDSGLMHTATAVDAPVVALFGSTVEEFGFFPYKSQSLVLENKSLNCRPCSHIGRSECPKGHFKCMKEITPQIVFDKLLYFYNSL
jgi:heptosyltransferase-2